ncbi:predicted protein [Histoplasma mississippiense (nom. inval.)]|uniref:predicted protein n=1 Tax=Ajellomyces capsulatus (strain NAm1 / WU24) TaxID=2059318 RepID=UPI000157C2DF|nr:predicted protein [Histoplasma mississippiense (nom. inval.)]EDN07654.1 predicted protein [Histoplasma mississippiense (nom. inval.)]
MYRKSLYMSLTFKYLKMMMIMYYGVCMALPFVFHTPFLFILWENEALFFV